MNLEKANKFELHYFLSDNSHLIDAFVRHKCEAEVLTITKDIAIALGYKVDILSEPFTEGGFRQFWKFLGKNNAQLTLIATIITLILSRIPISNSELEKLQQENIKLDNEEKRLNIEKLKKELKETENTDSSAVIQKVVEHFDNDYKIIKHKSNFYHTLQAYPKVSKISTTPYLDNDVIDDPMYVDRADFHKFILSTNELPLLTNENAIVEIVSPVLKNGKYKWKGIYNGNTIDFSMKDDKYKTSVIKKEITFQSGFYIECVLNIKRKIDDLGMIQDYSYSIITVLGRIEDNKIIETEQGKQHKRTKEDLTKQTKMF